MLGMLRQEDGNFKVSLAYIAGLVSEEKKVKINVKMFLAGLEK